MIARDGMGCLLCGGGDALVLHHRKPRRMGGRTDAAINAPSNLVCLCPDDHEWVESRRAEVIEMGLLLHEADDPRQVPVLHWRRGPVLLDDVGQWRPATTNGDDQ